MLLQLIVHQPEALGTVVRHTPPWVGALFVALVALGLTQARDRSASIARVMLMPAGMTVFSIWGTASAFAASPQVWPVLMAWLATAVAIAAVVARGRSDASFNPATHSFDLHGSWVPLWLILGIFLTKYVVGVELAMQPQLAAEAPFAYAVGTLYGVFSGVFVGRAWRLWRLTRRTTSLPAAVPVSAQA